MNNISEQRLKRYLKRSIQVIFDRKLLLLLFFPTLCYSFYDIENIWIDTSTMGMAQHEEIVFDSENVYKKVGEEIYKITKPISILKENKVDINVLKNKVKTIINKGNYEYKIDKKIMIPDGRTKVIFKRYYNDIYVDNAPITAIVDALGKLKVIIGLNLDSPNREFRKNSATKGIIDDSMGRVRETGVGNYTIREMEKCYHVIRKDDVLVIEPSYRIKYSVSGDLGTAEVEHVFSDDGLFLRNKDSVQGALCREIRSNENLYSGRTGSIGTLVAWEGQPSSDPLVIDAYDAIGDIYSYYNSVHSLDSFDNNGTTIKVTVRDTNLAPWWNNTEKRIYLGMWGGPYLCFDFVDATYAFDVIAHEYGHAVHTAYGFHDGYNFEQEAFCDFLSAHCESIKRPGSDTWKFGEDWIYASYPPNQHMDAFRYLDNPSALINPDSQSSVPDHFDNPSTGDHTYYEDEYEGAVNVAFYLMSQGGQHPTDSVFLAGYTPIDIDGIGMLKTARILMEGIPYRLSGWDVSLNTIVDSVVDSAYDLYGDVERCTVLSAWFAVGAVDSLWGENADGSKVTFMGDVYFGSNNWAYCDRFGWINWAEVYDASNHNLTDYFGAVYFYSDNCDEYYLTDAESYPWIFDYGTLSWRIISEVICN